MDGQTNVGIEIIREGGGEVIVKGNVAIVHYVGTLMDGTEFDSSLDRGEPLLFTLGAGQVIPGWEQGVEGMRIGEKRRLIIPPELAYGTIGTPDGPIPPNATLIFEIELLDTIDPATL
ncbi:MAG: FKBP-type peptidyl-prolyl cis-trans isomerase [Candidatus Colwellbacteria bacterium]|nr:FKBP-type peptidyl-prolyl cis-trans isomerase [Candidatus Colwellbacteria bacterium]